MEKPTKLGTFTSIPIEDDVGERGQWEYSPYEDERLITRSGDPRSFVMKKVSAHLAGLVEAYGLPPTMWKFRPTPRVRSLMDWPEELDLSKGLW